MPSFKDKTIVVTGGTGSLGKILTKRILSGECGTPRKLIIFSRDEAKQHYMRVAYQNLRGTDEVIYRNFERILEFRIGDVRSFHSVASVLRNADIVINAAALKQVPSCEYFPFEGIQTNVQGAETIVRVINELDLPIETVVGVSTDKACKPVNVMGMTKALQERIFISANIRGPKTRYVCVRYGNVLASRGSVIPLFHEQIRMGGPVTITTSDMTRFLLPLSRAVDTIFFALDHAEPGETIVPRVPAAKITDLATVLIAGRDIPLRITGIRPGEKVHEIMVSDEEAWRTVPKGNYYAIKPMLPELMRPIEAGGKPLSKEYSSGDDLMSPEQLSAYLSEHNLMNATQAEFDGELLR